MRGKSGNAKCSKAKPGFEKLAALEVYFVHFSVFYGIKLASGQAVKTKHAFGIIYFLGFRINGFGFAIFFTSTAVDAVVFELYAKQGVVTHGSKHRADGAENIAKKAGSKHSHNDNA